MAYYTWDYGASGIYTSSRITKEHDLSEVTSVQGSACYLLHDLLFGLLFDPDD
jgi:hypothetical protein